MLPHTLRSVAHLLVLAAFCAGVSGQTPVGELVLLRNIAPDEVGGDSGPSDFVSLGTSIYFVADADLRGREVFRTQGLLGSTPVLHLETSPGPLSRNPSLLGAVADRPSFTNKCTSRFSSSAVK